MLTNYYANALQYVTAILFKHQEAHLPIAPQLHYINKQHGICNPSFSYEGKTWIIPAGAQDLPSS